MFAPPLFACSTDAFGRFTQIPRTSHALTLSLDRAERKIYAPCKSCCGPRSVMEPRLQGRWMVPSLIMYRPLRAYAVGCQLARFMVGGRLCLPMFSQSSSVDRWRKVQTSACFAGLGSQSGSHATLDSLKDTETLKFSKSNNESSRDRMGITCSPNDRSLDHSLPPNEHKNAIMPVSAIWRRHLSLQRRSFPPPPTPRRLDSYAIIGFG